MSEGELGIVYFDLEEYDSAYKYSKLAFYSLPNNNTHRYTYFRTLTQREDSLELETAFNLIKDNNNTAHWVQYMLSRKAISRNIQNTLILYLKPIKLSLIYLQMIYKQIFLNLP